MRTVPHELFQSILNKMLNSPQRAKYLSAQHHTNTPQVNQTHTNIGCLKKRMVFDLL